jgi:xylulokinase
LLGIAYDIGTTGLKTVLYALDETIREICGASAPYPLKTGGDLPPGGAEQDPDDWWAAMSQTTRTVLAQAGVDAADIKGISFCAQMQGLVLVDADGRHLRPALSYMDQRATAEYKAQMGFGPQIAGANAARLLKSLSITGAVAASVKDPVYKYTWIQAHEPAVFEKVHKWLDVKEALIARMTGVCVMTPDSAFATLLYDVRPGKVGWSDAMCKMFGVNRAHLPDIIPCTQVAGTLRATQAAQLGLCAGTPVYGGGGDASLMGVGAGASGLGDTHIYCGTSGWVSTVVEKSIVDTSSMIAAIVGAQPERFNYFAEQETAGKCVEWVKDHLAADEIGLYLHKEYDFLRQAPDREQVYTNLYDYMMSVLAEVPIGAGGVLFTPWLHGNRCPFEDASARGMFIGLGLETGKRHMIRAVAEGVVYHLRWMLETQERKVQTGRVIRFVGGGALSDVLSRMLADCMGRTIETVAAPQNAGSVGAAALIAVGEGLIANVEQSKKLIPAAKTFAPDPGAKIAYDKYYHIYTQLYSANKKIFRLLG